MGIHTAWQALGQRPQRFLASSWPWRSLAYLLSGIAPSAAIAAGVLAFVALPASRAAPFVLPPLVVAILCSGPLVARYEWWRLRLVEASPASRPYRRAGGPGRRALEVGYGVVCVVALWLIDLAVVAVSLVIPVGLTTVALRSADAGGGTLAAMLAVAVLGLPVAAYPLTAWAGARSALARAILAPRELELDRRLVEVTRSRSRLVDAFELDRRRIERDLHDGAQQRLVALSLTLGMAESRLTADPAAAAPLIAQAREEARLAVQELRELASGIHPALLSERGLGPALEALAARAPVPTTVDGVPSFRVPPQVESAAYFVTAEALTNVAKYAGATSASVTLAIEHGRLLLVIRDDGAGGADPAAGSGLRGLRDRVEALDGQLHIDSPPGLGTTLIAEIPLGGHL
jgi:signal transduction histidine kinase